MGLIDADHPDEMTKKLEKKLIDTFGIIIINEYDIKNNVEFPESEVREGHFMATRYLQLQHPNKTGVTSGDGRSIWNGVVKHKGKVWDVSSCGTGATCLSPASAIQNKDYQSGDTTISYGCGYSEVDEGLSTLLFSEILHQNNIPTERVLLVLDYGKNIGISVRAYPNLLRPSHMFRYLKQNNLDGLKAMVDYYIDREKTNQVFVDVPSDENKRYDYLLEEMTYRFARMAAQFEDEYIFCWLDWDGDNILMDGAIIDYGSVRQFGLFHSEYRYDDVERYSTTIKEQKQKARYIVKVFIQLTDFLKKGIKTNLNEFNNHKMMDQFDKVFDYEKDKNLLVKIGFSDDAISLLLEKHRNKIQSLRDIFSYFESAKSKKGTYKVSDGITADAIFCMKDLLRELPQLYLSREESIALEDFFGIMASSYAQDEDLVITRDRKKKGEDFQKCYWDLINTVSTKTGLTKREILLDVSIRSALINKADRVTGDAVTLIIEKVMKEKGMDFKRMHDIFSQVINFQNLKEYDSKESVENRKDKRKKIINKLFNIVRDCREGL